MIHDGASSLDAGVSRMAQKLVPKDGYRPYYSPHTIEAILLP